MDTLSRDERFVLKVYFRNHFPFQKHSITDAVRDMTLLSIDDAEGIIHDLAEKNLLAISPDGFHFKLTDKGAERIESIKREDEAFDKSDFMPHAPKVNVSNPTVKRDRQPISRALSEEKNIMAKKQVFVVHGHDSGTKEMVARFLEKIGLEPVILHEKPSRGRTLIEKIEAHSTVHFAVVLLTPDDMGRASKDQDGPLNKRARQNVILELGYFIGKFGRERVAALKSPEVDMPSDFDGIVYTSLDAAGAWKVELMKELRAAEIPVDANAAL